MQFDSDAHKICYEKVAGYMKELFGEFALNHSEIPQFAVRIGSAFITINIMPWGTDDSVIAVHAWVVRKPEITPELMKYLLQENNSIRFGAFGMDNENDIFFQHTIVGSTCDKNELNASVRAVMYTADKYDDEIIARWGGQRSSDP